MYMIAYNRREGDIQMEKRKKMRIRTIAVLSAAVVFGLYFIAATKAAQLRSYNEFRERQTLWMEEDPEVEQMIRGYIDDVDWGSYIEYFAESLAHPKDTIRQMLDYYGKGD